MTTPTDSLESTALTAFDLVLQEVKQTQATSDSACTKELDILDREIQDIHTTLNAIQKVAKSRRASYRRRRNQLTSSLLRLPDEILSEIFTHSLHAMRSLNGETYYKCLGILRLVCTQFNAIADGTPRLWSLIYGRGRKNAERDLERVALLLKKSKNAPLDIGINIGIPGPHSTNNTLPMLQLLALHSHRWRSFRCQYMSESSDGDVLVRSSLDDIACLQVPRLLEFVIEHRLFFGIYRPKTDLFCSSQTSIQTLDVVQLIISWDSALLSGLKILRITAWDGVREPTEEQYLRMLSSCPRLKELHLQGRDQSFRLNESGASFHSPITLTELETLSMDYLHPVTVKSLLSSIKANPNVLQILFSDDLMDQWEEVIDATLLEPASRHIITRFTSSPNSLTMDDDVGDIPTLQLSTALRDDPVIKSFTCGFGESLQSVSLYRKLVEPSARKTISCLTLEIGTEHFDEDFGYRELLQELVGLRELYIGGEVELLTLLVLLSEQASSGSPEGPWLCPDLRELHLDCIPFEITDLWTFIVARYGHKDSPTRLELLTVQYNETYASIDDVPIDVASIIADFLGNGNFQWEGFTLGTAAEREWE
ncbi:hypothetical protein FRC02_001449 [Tulasnella sp. 418]|nr:hypothetical protein FRC02_001449 [Tulasnella sp. 418]